MGSHERINFVHYTHVTHKDEDAHHVALYPYYPKLTAQQKRKTVFAGNNLPDLEALNDRQNAFDLEDSQTDRFEQQ